MSTRLKEGNADLETPKSSKKRKHASESKESSKKKRKHERAQEEIREPAESQESPLKAEKKKKKKRSKEATNEVLPLSSAPTEVEIETHEDTEPPDAHAVEEVVVEDVTMAEGSPEVIAEVNAAQMESQEPTCFHSTRLSLYLPISPIALSTATSSILSQHLAPLLLTYFPPAGGIILSFSDPVLSARPEAGLNLPLKPPRKGKIPKHPPDETFSRVGDEFGACWVWLTATFLVFRPEPGNKLSGWTNVTSEGFVGLVSYNYFQTAVGRSRIPQSWTWNGPTREQARGRKRTRKGKLNDSQEHDQETVEVQEESVVVHEDEAIDGIAGSFLDAHGQQVPEVLTFRVVDVEMVPAHERNKWSLQIDGSLLSDEEEAEARREDQAKFENLRLRSRSRSRAPGTPLMSGALNSASRQGSVALSL